MNLYPYESAHIEKMRRIAPECMVLLKSNGQFPLDAPCQIALYGSGARRTLKGGTGSGDVNSRFYVTVEQGLKKVGFTITTEDWLDAYDTVAAEARKTFVADIWKRAREMGVPPIFLGIGAVMPEPEYDLPLLPSGDIALYVLSRVSGEGADRRAVKGDILLTDTEVRDILHLYRTCKRFMLVLNVGGMVDLTPVQEVENILLLSQLGVVTGDALADVLLGKATPSGKLTATWTGWEDYCTVGEFGNEDDTAYKEGIYVGYRYFDSVHKEVLFPFGHGLSYTDFSMGEAKVTLNGTRVQVQIPVRNVGHRPGKEVVQLYVSVPARKLDQPYQVLAAFEKTRTLLPGEEELVFLTFSMEQLASFDSAQGDRILEAGDYILRCGNSSRNTKPWGCIRLEEDVIVKKLSPVGGDSGFIDWKLENAPYGCVDDSLAVPVLTIATEVFDGQPPLPRKETAEEAKIAEMVGQLSDSQLAYLCCGNFRRGEEKKSFIGNAAIRVPGAAGETTDRLAGIPGIVMADGPAGLRLTPQYGVDEQGMYSVGDAVPTAFSEFIDETVLALAGLGGQEEAVPPEARQGEIIDQYCTAIPIGTALAQSWNPEVCFTCGDVVGAEMERFGIHLWLAPALNIQRNPLCGRNFEYCSEDPLLSGKTAAAITRGVQSHPGRGVTIKHFCCNNQETNRFRSNSQVSQRALRDIYLRGFEICIEESHPVALMTSYNLLNGVHTCERRDLLEGILREEWGYEGLIMSDWVTRLFPVPKKYAYISSRNSVKAGNDIIMGGSQEDYEDILSALTEGELSREEAEKCACRVVRTACRLTNEERSCL